MSWDSTRSRFVFVALDNFNFGIWYGYSTDASGTSWQFRHQQVFVPTDLASWDYPSIGEDAVGRIIIGAVSMRRVMPPGTDAPDGFYTELSVDGGATCIGARVGNTCIDGCGARSRVIATNDTFHAFTAGLNANFVPFYVDRYQHLTG